MRWGKMQQYQCPSCGAPVALGARFCGACGALLVADVQEPRKGTSPWLIVLVIFIAIVFIGGGLLLALDKGYRISLHPTTKPTTPSILTSQPIINSFKADPENINTGDNCTLSWDVTGATSIIIDNGIGSVAGSGSITIWVPTTTTYTLTAANTVGNVTKSVLVTVTNTPEATTPALVNILDTSDLSSNLLIYLDWQYTQLWDSKHMPDINDLPCRVSPLKGQGWSTCTLTVFLKNIGTIPIKVNATSSENPAFAVPGYSVSSDTVVIKPNEHSPLTIKIDDNPDLHSGQSTLTLYFHIDAVN
jgi:archaellum component FlaG (FlaF/FlaG flagellin family)